MKRILIFLLAFCLLASAASAELLPALTERSTLHSGFDPGTLISDDQINLIIQAAPTMPTGGDQRSLELYVVTDRETMADMRGGNPWSQALETAPVVIVVAGNDDQAFYPELQEMDAGLAAGAMLVQASSMGLSTCVLSIAPQEQRIASVRTALGMEEAITPILMVALGYPETDAISSASVENEVRVHWKENE